jgi:serine/threonine protein kinase
VFHSGQKIGHYTLIAKLGHGGFGEVWLAEKRSEFVTKKVAVKLPHQGQINFDAIRQEATLWEQASGHPNVLPIIDADVLDGQVVIVSEYADGGSLADRLARDGMLSLKQSVEMVIGILSGLEFLHERKIIHRDIKPQNILLQGKTPRLADFGISRAMQATMVSSAIIGTDAYMSPEAFDGKRNAQTDIWSVGVVLYQLIKGSLPFPQDHPSERMFAVLTKEFAPLPPDVPSDLRRIVAKALEKEPSNRYASAEEMREDLQKALIGIAHPTLAKTEILHQSTFPAEVLNETAKQSDTPTVALNNLTEATEIKTVVNKHSNQPAPTQAAFEPRSVVTQYAQTPTAENKPKPFPPRDSVNVSGNKKLKGWMIAGIGFVFVVIIFTLFSVKQDRLTPFSDSTGKYGYKGAFGRVIVEPKYDEAEPFNNGFGRVKLNKKYGYVNGSGSVVISVKYDYVDTNFNGEYAVLVRDGVKWRIDKFGRETYLSAVTTSGTTNTTTNRTTNMTNGNTTTTNTMSNTMSTNTTTSNTTANTTKTP